MGAELPRLNIGLHQILSIESPLKKKQRAKLSVKSFKYIISMIPAEWTSFVETKRRCRPTTRISGNTSRLRDQ